MQLEAISAEIGPGDRQYFYKTWEEYFQEGHRLKRLMLVVCRAGKHAIVFLVKGPLYLVAVSRQGEPEAVLRHQLACLHAQIVCILTNGFEQIFLRNSRFDSRRLLGVPLSPPPSHHNHKCIFIILVVVKYHYSN